MMQPLKTWQQCKGALEREKIKMIIMVVFTYKYEIMIFNLKYKIFIIMSSQFLVLHFFFLLSFQVF